MKCLFVIGIMVLLAACTPVRETGMPLILGPGPCSDTIGGTDVSDPTYVIDGCLSFLLVEATRDEQTAPISVEGRVLTAGSHRPVPGANVLVFGQNRGASTDLRGRFSIGALNPRDRLIVSATGYLPDTLHVSALPGPRLLLTR